MNPRQKSSSERKMRDPALSQKWVSILCSCGVPNPDEYGDYVISGGSAARPFLLFL
jgi:hypothetical protein